MENTTDTLSIQISKAREEISPVSVSAIDAVSWKLILEGINKSYNNDQLYNLIQETELLLYGLINTQDYPRELESRMRLHKAEVETLIKEIDRLIFKKIQEELEKRLGQKKDAPVKKEVVLDPRFTNLPIETQRAISLSDWKESLFGIANKYKLNIEQTGELEQITIKTLTNTIHTDQYENEIKIKFNLHEEKNKEMVTEINEKVFKNIKELMQKASTRFGRAPLPPYIQKREVPRPENQMIAKNTEVPTEAPSMKVAKIDPYKEHGIEIISDEKPKEEIIIPEIKNKETIVAIKNANFEIKKENSFVATKKENEWGVEQKPLVNIIMDKLMKKTVNNISVSNYSIPKMSTSTPVSTTLNTNTSNNPHDAYHEAI